MDLNETIHIEREWSVRYNGTNIKTNGQCMWDLKIKYGFSLSRFPKIGQNQAILEGFLGFIIAI